MVDSNTIDCEGGFRSRIYWEPLPAAPSTQPAPIFGTNPVPRIFRGSSSADAGAADSSEQVSADGAKLGVLKPAKSFKNKAVEEAAFYQAAPEQVIYDPELVSEPEMEIEEEVGSPPSTPEEIEAAKRETEEAKKKARAEKIEKTAPLFGMKDWRANLRQRVPASQKWPLERIYPMELLPWLLAGLLAIIVLFVVVGGKDKNKVTADAAAINSAATQTAQITTSSFNRLTPAFTSGIGTPSAAITTASPLKGKSGTITGLGNGEILRLRSQPSISSDILDKLKDGDKVKIVEGPLDADKLEWYRVEANGKTGWVVKKYVIIQS